MSIPRLIDYQLPERADAVDNAVNWPFEAAQAGLLIHDMQQYFVGFFDRSSALVSTVVSNIARLAQAARSAGMPVFYTAQPGDQSRASRGLLYDFWGPGLTAAANHVGFVPELAPQVGDIELRKHRYSAFHGTELAELLSKAGRSQLLITGVYAHIGCLATALDAFMADFQPFFAIDAVADFNRADHLLAATLVAKRCGSVTDTAAALAAICAGQAAVPESLDALRRTLSVLLRVPLTEVEDDSYLPDLGLDSISVMQFAERWRGLNINYVALAQDPSPRAWMGLIQEGRAATSEPAEAAGLRQGVH